MFALTNQARAARGVAPVQPSSILESFAKQQSETMARRGRIFHSTLPDGIIAENVGAVSADEGWPQTLQDAFMQSPDHRFNILDGRLKLLGVGVSIVGGVAYVAEEYGIFEQRAAPSVSCTPIVRTDCSYRLTKP